MGLEILTLGAAKKNVKNTADSLGSLKGAPCTIKSQTETDDSYIVTFEWTGTSGTTETSQLIIKKPKDGVDGKTPVKGVDYFDGVNGQDGQPGEKGADGSDGIGISSITKISTVGLVDTYRIAFTDNTTFDYSISNGKDGAQGLKGDKGEQGERGVQGIQGIQGERGADGYPFLIYKEYSDISEFNADDFPEIGLMFMIKADDTTSFPVYRYTGDITTPYSHVTDLTSGESIKGEKGDTGLQGEQGIPGQDGADGITYTPTIGAVTSGTTASASVTVNKDTSTATFNFVIPKGDKGDIGASGTTPYIDGTTKHWMIDSQDTGILAEGANGSDGITPHIGSNNNWFIGDTDTGVLAKGSNGKDGKSIRSITKDEHNNIITTFTDGTTQNIGQLSIDVQADFLTSGGFGNLRYYNGHFQYYDAISSTWIDTSISPDNVYIMNMMPQPMQKIMSVYDIQLCKYKLKWQEPCDTVIEGQVACIVDKVIIRRKLNSVPTNETDGDLVIEVKRKDFNSYKNEYFVDQALTPNNGDIYYYKAFPVSTTGFYNYSTLNETSGIVAKDYVLYGFKLDQNEPDPASMITYLSDCDNKYYESAKMNYATDTFNYGDWGDVWFIKNLKPCMLKYDGTVDYELNKNDYTKKLNGTNSDIANTSYSGNAMIGIPKVYWKIVDNGDNTANIYVSDKKIDSDFHCWSHIDNNGNEIDYCYMPIYNGSNVNSVLRSISGKTPMGSQTASTEITYAKANNISSDIIWYTELFNDRMLINLLLLLIGKSTNTQVIFGTGNSNSYISESNTGIKNTGTMNTKGLFWGNQDNKSGVKVFGMEHWWGNQSRRIGGWINDKGTQKIKMTYGHSDGSTVDEYNLDGNGYITIANSTPSSTTGGYISKMLITNNGLIPTIASGSATTYYCDGLWASNSQVNYANVGGNSNFASSAGAFCSNVYRTSSFAVLTFGASISCKPLATT